MVFCSENIHLSSTFSKLQINLVILLLETIKKYNKNISVRYEAAIRFE